MSVATRRCSSRERARLGRLEFRRRSTPKGLTCSKGNEKVVDEQGV